MQTETLAEQLVAGDLSGIEALFLEAGSQPPWVRIDPMVGRIGDSRLEVLFNYWVGLPRDRDGCPMTTHLDPIDISSVLPVVMLLKVVDEGRDFQYEIYGEEIAARLGTNLLGRCTSQVPTASYIARFFVAVYMASMRLRRPILTEHMPPPKVSVTAWRRLILPFVNDTGEVVRLLVGNVPGEWRRPEA